MLNLSASLYLGPPQFILTVDGKQDGAAQAVTTTHSSGMAQAFTFPGLASGPHDLGISFINDAYGGTPQTDRNLYVNSIDYAGVHYDDVATLARTSTVHFVVGQS